jgi:tetratricopeptide (TPR) repeat protein
LENYTEKARQTILYAKLAADRSGCLEIGTEHILLGLLKDEVLIARVMQASSVKEIRKEIANRQPTQEMLGPRDLPLSEEARKALTLASEEAVRLADSFVRNQHLLLGLLRTEDCLAAELLRRMGLSLDSVRGRLASFTLEGSILKESVREAPKTSAARESLGDSSLRQLVLETIGRVGELSKSGKQRKALSLLDDLMAKPGEDRSLRIRHFAPIAAATAHSIGDLELVRRYCEQTLESDPEDPLALFDLASCLAEQGKRNEARRCAAKCYDRSLARNDEAGRGLVELIQKKFPELKERL